METWNWILMGLIALALAVGVISAIVIASRRPGQPLGLRDPNRDPSANFQPQGAPQGWGRFSTETTRGSSKLSAESEDSVRANADSRARVAEANAAVRIAEIAQRGNLLIQAAALGQPRFFAGGQGSAAERQPAPAPAATPVVVNVYNTTPPAPARGGGGAAADGGGGAPARGNRRGAADPAAGGT